MTGEGYAALDEELKRLKTQERPAVVAARLVGGQRLAVTVTQPAQPAGAAFDWREERTRTGNTESMNSTASQSKRF